MRARIALDAQVHALAQTILVLGMERGAAADRLEHGAHALVILDQQRAGGRTHEHLDRAGAGQPLELGKLVRVLAGGADIKGEVAVHAVMRALDLVGQRLGRDRQRIGIRHLEHRRHAAEHGAARTRFQIFFMREAGLAEMNVTVDHARQQMQAAAVDDVAGRGARQVADGGEAAAADADVAQALAVVVDHGAALEDQVVGLSHCSVALEGLAAQGLSRRP